LPFNATLIIVINTPAITHKSIIPELPNKEAKGKPEFDTLVAAVVSVVAVPLKIENTTTIPTINTTKEPTTALIFIFVLFIPLYSTPRGKTI